MAVITKTLKESGGHYSSIITWESTEQTDLAAAHNNHILNCDSFTEDAGVGAFVLAGWVTTSDHNVVFQGVDYPALPWSSGSCYTFQSSLAGATNYVMIFNQRYSEGKKFQLHSDSACTTRGILFAVGFKLQNFIHYDESTGIYGLYSSSNNTITVSNAIHFNATASTAKSSFVVNSSSGFTCHNCLSFAPENASYGFRRIGGNLNVNSCISIGCTTAGRDFNANAIKTTCATSQSSANSGLNGVAGTVFDINRTGFTDYANCDFRHTIASLAGAGTDASPYNDADILGVTRSTVPNIGPWEWIVIFATLGLRAEVLGGEGGNLGLNAELLLKVDATRELLAELLLAVSNGGVVNAEVWSNAILAAIGLSAELLLSVSGPVSLHAEESLLAGGTVDINSEVLLRNGGLLRFIAEVLLTATPATRSLVAEFTTLVNAVPSLGGEVLLLDVGANDVHAEALLGAGGGLTLLAELILQATPATSSILAEFLTLVSAAKNVRAEVVGGLVASALGIPAEFLLSVEADSNLYIVFDYVDSRTFRIYCVTLGAEVRDFPGEFPERIYHADIGDEIRETDGSILAETRTNIATIEGNIR